MTPGFAVRSHDKMTPTRAVQYWRQALWLLQQLVADRKLALQREAMFSSRTEHVHTCRYAEHAVATSALASHPPSRSTWLRDVAGTHAAWYHHENISFQ
jgi:hypothetical protein